MKQTCNRRQLSANSVCAIESTSCGIITVHVGPFSFRVSIQSLQAMQHAFTEAIDALTVKERPEPQPLTAPDNSKAAWPRFSLGVAPRGKA